MPNEIEDRRQRAREAFYDAYEENGSGGAAELAIETATQVKITPEIQGAISAVEDAWGAAAYRKAVAKIFELAGFEVIE